MALTKITRGLLNTGVSDSSDATAITIDSSERVMIGTTDPGYPDYGDSLTLGDVDGGGGNSGMTIRSGTSSYGTFYFSDATGTAAGTYAGKMQYNHSNNSMVFATNSSDRLTINSSGQVGIGTTSPTSILHISATAEARLILEGDSDNDSGEESSLLEFRTDGGAVRHRVEATGSSGNNLKITAGADQTTNTLNSEIIFETKTANASTAERMRIDADGNVGIGTTSMTQKLAVNGNIQLLGTGTDNDSYSLLFKNGACAIARDANDLELHAYDNMIFGVSNTSYPSSTEKMRILSTASYANVCIGRTGVIGDSSVGLHLTTGGWAIGEGTAGNTTAGSYRRAYFASANDGLYYWNGNNQAYLTSAGVWEDASDERLKKDIIDIPYGLDVVKSLKPRKYKMKADDLEQIGFIAQEVKDIIPEVTTFTTVEHTDKENGDQYGLSYGHLTAVLTKAIQEQQTIIDDLKSRIETLEG